jgi:hypothetical protein
MASPRLCLIVTFACRLLQNFSVTEAELRQEFEHYGPVKQIVLVKNTESNKPRGYAFVEFEHSSDLKGTRGRTVCTQKTYTDSSTFRVV